MEHVYNYETFIGKNVKADELNKAGEVHTDEVNNEETTIASPEDILEEESAEPEQVTEIQMDENKRIVQKFSQYKPS